MDSIDDPLIVLLIIFLLSHKKYCGQEIMEKSREKLQVKILEQISKRSFRFQKKGTSLMTKMLCSVREIAPRKKMDSISSLLQKQYYL